RPIRIPRHQRPGFGEAPVEPFDDDRGFDHGLVPIHHHRELAKGPAALKGLAVLRPVRLDHLEIVIDPLFMEGDLRLPCVGREGMAVELKHVPHLPAPPPRWRRCRSCPWSSWPAW